MSQEWNEQRLLSYINGQIEESINLDYKGAGALAKQKTTEITKDVSAFANSGGGLIIYGIREFQQDGKSHLPERLDPINRREFDKEWLEHVIANIQPRPTVIIHPVPLSSGESDVAYVVEIPIGKTAHQATDRRYYKRHNFESVAMYDFEIRDVMRRKTSPIVSTEIHIHIGKHGFRNRVFWKIKNESEVLAKHVTTVIKMPNILFGTHIKIEDADLRIDEEGFTSYILSPGNNVHRPLFPKSQLQAEIPFTFVEVRLLEGKPDVCRDTVLYTTYADEMTPVDGVFKLQDICHKNNSIG